VGRGLRVMLSSFPFYVIDPLVGEGDLDYRRPAVAIGDLRDQELGHLVGCLRLFGGDAASVEDLGIDVVVGAVIGRDEPEALRRTEELERDRLCHAPLSGLLAGLLHGPMRQSQLFTKTRKRRPRTRSPKTRSF
jgi:hypothetical protein